MDGPIGGNYIVLSLHIIYDNAREHKASGNMEKRV